MGPADLDWNAVCYSARRTSPAAAGGRSIAGMRRPACRASVQYTEMNVYSPSFVNRGENILFLCIHTLSGFIRILYVIILLLLLSTAREHQNVRPTDRRARRVCIGTLVPIYYISRAHNASTGLNTLLIIMIYCTL